MRNALARFRHRLRSEEPLRALVRITSVFLAFFALSIGMYSYFDELGVTDAIWLSWQTFTTVGYGDIPAKTPTVKYLTIFISTVGIALLGAVFSAAFTYQQHIVNKRIFGKMDNPFRNGYVVFNFPGPYQTANLIEQLRTVEENVPVCIVDSNIEQLPDWLAQTSKTHFIRGNILSKETYEMARLQDNKAAIIFPTEPTVSDSDGATKTIVDLVSKFVGNRTRIMHVLVDYRNSWMFEGSPSTQILEGLELLAIVQECQDIHSSTIVEKMLKNTQGANLQTVKIERIVGWTWRDFITYAVPASVATGQPSNPVGMISAGRAIICPALDIVLKEGDYLSLVAHNDFDWAAFEAAMIAARDRDRA